MGALVDSQSSGEARGDGSGDGFSLHCKSDMESDGRIGECWMHLFPEGKGLSPRSLVAIANERSSFDNNGCCKLSEETWSRSMDVASGRSLSEFFDATDMASISY